MGGRAGFICELQSPLYTLQGGRVAQVPPRPRVGDYIVLHPPRSTPFQILLFSRSGRYVTFLFLCALLPMGVVEPGLGLVRADVISGVL